MTQTDMLSPAQAARQISVLTFLVAGREFAVELAHVEHVLDYQPPTRTPLRPPHIEGIIRHRGRYLPVANLRKRLGVEGASPASPAILLLTGVGQDPVVGLMVDQVLRVLALALDKLLAPPPRVFGIRSEFIRGVANAGGRPVVWLDAAKLLMSPEPITLLA